jgi:hypothetical protein
MLNDTAPNIVKIPELLETARDNGLRWPKIRLQTPVGKDGADGEKLVLSLAGPKARFPRTVNLTDGGRYSENVWYGRIHTNGRLEEGRGMTGAVRTLLITLAGDPAGTAQVHGALTGNCCFCGRELTTKESVGAGYGPVCASKWRLPWGAETAAQYEEKKGLIARKLAEQAYFDEQDDQDARHEDDAYRANQAEDERHFAQNGVLSDSGAPPDRTAHAGDSDAVRGDVGVRGPVLSARQASILAYGSEATEEWEIEEEMRFGDG